MGSRGTLVFVAHKRESLRRWLVVALVIVVLALAVWASYGFHYK